MILSNLADTHFKPTNNKSGRNLFLDMRVRALYSPYYFIKSILGYENLDPTFHLPELEIFTTAWSEGYTKQNIQWPRGWYKTTCFTTGMAIWIVLPVRQEDSDYAIDVLGIPKELWEKRIFLHDRNATQLIAMETSSNAKKKVLDIGWHFKENMLFRQLFPEIAYTGKEPKWNDECIIISRDDTIPRAEGTFEAIGVDGALQSRHYKIVWEDDLVGFEALRSETVMASTVRWHSLLNGAFLNVENQVRFVIGNTWRLNDLNSYIAANEPDFLIHKRAAYENDPETGELRSTCENIISLEGIIALRQNGSMKYHDFCAQYLNSPTVPGETELNNSALHTYSVEAGDIVCSCGLRVNPRNLQRMINYDPYNAKGVSSKSCPAIIAVGTGPDKHVFVLDIYSARGNYTAVFKKIFQFSTRWKTHVLTYEDVGHQNLTEEHIRAIQQTEEFTKSKFHRITRFIPVKSTREKFQRIRDGLFNALEHTVLSIQNVHQKLHDQLSSFPNERFEDDYDLLDALNQGVNFWQFPLPETYAQEQAESESEILRALVTPYTHQKESPSHADY